MRNKNKKHSTSKTKKNKKSKMNESVNKSSTAELNISDIEQPEEVSELEATIVQFEKQAEPINLNHFMTPEIQGAIKRYAALTDEEATVSKEIAKLVSERMFPVLDEFTDIPQQVDAVKKTIMEAFNYIGLMNVLRLFRIEMMFKNPATGYRQPLDLRIVKLADKMNDELVDAWREEANVYPQLRITQKERVTEK